MRRILICTLLLAIASVSGSAAADDSQGKLTLHTRSRAADEQEKFRFVYKTVDWDPAKTAVIVCDMWDKHWCQGATGRVAELAPRMNRFLCDARKRGVLIVHAPSSCMDAYAEHPARKRAQDVPKAELPGFLGGWSGKLDSEKDAKWPIDQSDGGCDCRPKCPGGHPWKRQIDVIEIHDADAVSDSGVEIGNLMQDRGIENVILLGVHTNMCVIGRPFGLRNMVRFGKKVLLVRDLTDTMYNSRSEPRVSHVRGTELIVEYIEKYVCPTITSSDLLGGPALRFRQDTRPHVAMIVSDDHYHADKTLPIFAENLRANHDCYCTVLHGEGKADIAGMDELDAADVAVLYIRRLALPKPQLDALRRYLDAGKPLVGLRTASHAFDVHGQAPAGADEWPTFDGDVLGGSYHGHGSNTAGADVTVVAGQADHAVLAGVDPRKWHSTGSLYNVSPVNDDATVLMTGTNGTSVEPITWTREYKGGRVFYSALGHPDDFQQPQFRTMLVNALFWAMDRPVSYSRCSLREQNAGSLR